jgi:hypothetical protein
MDQPLLSSAFLFRYAIPCLTTAVSGGGPIALSEQHRLPNFGHFEGQAVFADVRSAWHASGLFLDIHVTGKKQTLWCRHSRVEESDGLHVWIDTRDSHNIHRANRFCHCFVFLPAGDERLSANPVGTMLPINRARENPRPVEPRQLQVRSLVRRDGYRLQAFIPSSAMTGYDPSDQPRIGFFYSVVDRELGCQTLSVGSEFPFDEDPTLWGTLDLIRK